MDVDPIELAKTQQRLESLGYGSDILTTRHMNFSEIDKIVLESGPLNFVLADLGVSSMQIDNPERGFSFKSDGPLDLRLNPQRGVSAAARLKTISQAELEGMLIENSDEPNAAVIAHAIVAAKNKGIDISTTTMLRQIITDALKCIPKDERKEETKKSCQRCFQALRIDVNHEHEVLSLKNHFNVFTVKVSIVKLRPVLFDHHRKNVIPIVVLVLPNCVGL